jgi:hypothetical protein
VGCWRGGIGCGHLRSWFLLFLLFLLLLPGRGGSVFSSDTHNPRGCGYAAEVVGWARRDGIFVATP